jgi:hypothetical protein
MRILVEPEAGEDTADGGATEAGGLCDVHPGMAQAAQSFDLSDACGGGAARHAMGTGRAIRQSRRTQFAKTPHPLGRRLPAELELGRGLLQAQSAVEHSLGQFRSKENRTSGIMVVVHSVS